MESYSPTCGDWEFFEPPSAPWDPYWRQLRTVPGLPAVELCLKTPFKQPPAALDCAWALHVIENRQLFLHAFVYWGRMAFYDMGLAPESFGGGAMFCELELSAVIIPENCFTPLLWFKKEYEIQARHPVHREFEFRSKWRGLEPVHVGVVRNDGGDLSVTGQVCLREGTLENQLARAVETYDTMAREPFSALRFQLLKRLDDVRAPVDTGFDQACAASGLSV